MPLPGPHHLINLLAKMPLPLSTMPATGAANNTEGPSAMEQAYWVWDLSHCCQYSCHPITCTSISTSSSLAWSTSALCPCTLALTSSYGARSQAQDESAWGFSQWPTAARRTTHSRIQVCHKFRAIIQLDLPPLNALFLNPL